MIRVITPASNRALTTLEAAKLEMNIIGTAEDALLSRLIERASAIAASWCNRVFARETVEETFDLSRPSDALHLSRWPVITPEVATMGCVEVEEWEAGAEDGICQRLVNDKPVPWPATRIVVRYTAGYVLPGETDDLTPAGYYRLPADVEAGCLALVRRLYHGRDRDPGIRSVNYGSDSVTYGTFGRLDGEGMPGEVVNLLSPYWQLKIA